MRIAHAPRTYDDPRQGPWVIAAAARPLGIPRWTATFSAYTPAEIVHAFTSTLVDTLAVGDEGFLYGNPALAAGTPASVLDAHGWRRSNSDTDCCHHAPDPHSYTYFRSGRQDADPIQEIEGQVPAAWSMYSCVERVNGPRWHADITSGTPLHLVTAAAAALADPTPVHRHAADLPERNLPYLTTCPFRAEQHADTTRPRTAAPLSAPPPPHPAHRAFPTPRPPRR